MSNSEITVNPDIVGKRCVQCNGWITPPILLANPVMCTCATPMSPQDMLRKMFPVAPPKASIFTTGAAT